MKKKIGAGTSSFAVFLFAVIWGKNTALLEGKCLGDVVLNKLKIPTWSTTVDGNLGTHYTVFFAFPILLVAIIIGYKYREHLFAKSGCAFSVCFLLVLFIELAISIIGI